jgi:hypothetical protein
MVRDPSSFERRPRQTSGAHQFHHKRKLPERISNVAAKDSVRASIRGPQLFPVRLLRAVLSPRLALGCQNRFRQNWPALLLDVARLHLFVMFDHAVDL